MYSRQRINKLDDFAIKQLNDNFMALFLKLSGNIDTLNLKDDAITEDKIKDNSVTGDKILDGSITIANIDDDFVSDIDLLENPIFLSLSSDVEINEGKISRNTTAIQQNSKEIKLSAEKINLNEHSISELRVTAQGIQTNVSNIQRKQTEHGNKIEANASSITQTAREIRSTIYSLESDMNGELDLAWSSINQNSREISSKVSENGLISTINQQAGRIKISADSIDLEGITRIYSYDSGNTYLELDGRYGDFSIVSGRSTVFEIRNGYDSASMRSYGDAHIVFGADRKTHFYRACKFTDDISVEGTIYAEGGIRDTSRSARSVFSNELGLMSDNVVYTDEEDDFRVSKSDKGLKVFDRDGLVGTISYDVDGEEDA